MNKQGLFYRSSIPVPVPKSRILPGFGAIGAQNNLSSSSLRCIACCMSSLSVSASSLGNAYSSYISHIIVERIRGEAWEYTAFAIGMISPS